MLYGTLSWCVLLHQTMSAGSQFSFLDEQAELQIFLVSRALLQFMGGDRLDQTDDSVRGVAMRSEKDLPPSLVSLCFPGALGARTTLCYALGALSVVQKLTDRRRSQLDLVPSLQIAQPRRG